MDDKKLVITGINSKYQMKKILGLKQKDPKQRSIWDDNLITDDLFISSNQLNAIVDIHNSNPIYLKEITKKVNGYKNQDTLKTRLVEGFITIQQTIELLNACELTCYYCRCFTSILYKNARDGSQWSLDRIDNDIGHTQSNVVVSCLKCNLQKKRLSTNAFIMTKQMIITRVE